MSNPPRRENSSKRKLPPINLGTGNLPADHDLESLINNNEKALRGQVHNESRDPVFQTSEEGNEYRFGASGRGRKLA